MGGMAIGSWLVSRFSFRISRLLIVYALVELLLGLAAIVFHKNYLFVVGSSYEHIFPVLENPYQVQAWKWLVASLMIIPQCILLGATFPLFVGGVLRKFDVDQGYLISIL